MLFSGAGHRRTDARDPAEPSFPSDALGLRVSCPWGRSLNLAMAEAPGNPLY